MNKIEKFYDQYQKRLCRDYVLGNERSSKAIRSIIGKIDVSGLNILDIGCGIGWSSHEMSKTANSVVGIDLSKELIGIAAELFSRENLSFLSHDVSKNFDLNEKFDLVTLIDVFEHLDPKSRPDFIKSINNLLNPSGRIFISCPSIHHQGWLRENNPDGLQPIDEDITPDIVLQFAQAINGELTYFAYQNVWKLNDYFHAILQKRPVLGSDFRGSEQLETLSSRFGRLRKFNAQKRLFNKKEFFNLSRAQKQKRWSNFKEKIKRYL